MPETIESLSVRFQVERRLAIGGFGEVFLARDGRTGARAVVKVLRQGDDVRDVARFAHEIDIARSLRLPRVPRHLADGRFRDRPAFAMEFVVGRTLADLATTGALVPATAVALTVDLLQVLASLHEVTTDDGLPRRLVHRDVSPQNIMCDRDGRGWLIDFGVSVDAGFCDDRAGGIVGKLAYMAPEQAAGFDVDARADQFSAGVVLWELLTGRSLFRGPNERLLWNSVIACDVPRLSDLSLVPCALADVVDRMLAADRARRFASCAAAAAALAAAARPLGPPNNAWRAARRRRPRRRASTTLVLAPRATAPTLVETVAV